jgi:sugar phosphate isomerase/epimerase
MSAATPVIGAAVVLETFERLRNWAFERERDVELQDFFAPEVLDGDWTALTDRYRRLLDGHRGRIGIHGPFWGFAIDTHDSEVAAVVRKRLGQGLDVCAAVGATQMVLHSPFTTWDAHNLDAWAGARGAMIERVHRNIGAIVRRAEEQGVELVIENIEDKDPAERRRLAESFDSDAVKLSIDTGHAHYAHGATGAPPVDYFVTSAGEMLAHVHLQDADGWADRHWAIGEGTIRWPAVFAALARLEAKPRLLLELLDHDRIVESAERLEALGLAQ